MISCFLLRLHMDLFFCFTTDDGDVSLHCCRAAGMYWDMGTDIRNWKEIPRIGEGSSELGKDPQNWGWVPRIWEVSPEFGKDPQKLGKDPQNW